LLPACTSRLLFLPQQLLQPLSVRLLYSEKGRERERERERDREGGRERERKRERER
jgi:hypothetical protein